MMQTSRLLELRKKIKGKKPEFIRQDIHKRKKLSLKWRKPKGIHSKMRHKFKGRRKMPSPGYKSPSQVYGMHATGLRVVNVHSLNDIDKVVKDSEGIIISKQVGLKKKFEMLKRAEQLGITALNINIGEQIRKIENFMSSKKKKEKEAKKETKEKAGAKEPAQKETDEQKKEAEKREKDKVLTKKV